MARLSRSRPAARTASSSCRKWRKPPNSCAAVASQRPRSHHAGVCGRGRASVLQGKVAWLTGAGSGIGRAGAQALAEAGATAIVSGRSREGLDEAVALDVADKTAVARIGAEIVSRHGGVDILVNSAGLNLSTRLWRDMTPDSFDHIVHINLNGALYCIHAVLPAMRARRSGLVINISSWAGRFEEYLTGPAYNAS